MQQTTNPQLTAAFNTLVRTLRLALSHALKQQDYPLTPPDITTLSLLSQHPGLSLQKLVALNGKDKTHITRKIKELERKQLVYRKKDIDDQRSYQLFLTPEGKIAQRKTQAIKAKVYQQTFAKLNPKEQTQLAELLQKCLGEEGIND